MASTDHSLLIVGCGTLGLSIAKQYLLLHPDAHVAGETQTPARHAVIAAAGVTPAIVGESGTGFARVVFAAPPGCPDYAAAVAAAAARIRPGGVFVFTGSGSVFVSPIGAEEAVFEDSPVRAGEPGRAAELLAAEAAALAVAGGAVVRCGGLYNADRSVPMLRRMATEQSAASGGGGGDMYINWVHYDDAAAMVVAVLERAPADGARNLFLAADGAPTPRRALLAQVAKIYDPNTGNSGDSDKDEGPVVGKMYDNSVSRKELGWAPQWKSIVAFMRENALTLEPAPVV